MTLFELPPAVKPRPVEETYNKAAAVTGADADWEVPFDDPFPPGFDDDLVLPPGGDLMPDPIPVAPAAVVAAPQLAPVEPAAVMQLIQAVNAAPVTAEPSKVEESVPAFTYFVVPDSLESAETSAEKPPRMVKVILKRNHDKERDVRRLKRILGLLRSSPGHDRFVLMVFEEGHYYLIEFPNDTTGISAELLGHLEELAGGAENVQIEPLAA
jgi:DNA polymerase-3 subunit alpha